MSEIERVMRLVSKGQEVFATQTQDFSGFPATVNIGVFTSWRTQVLSFLASILPTEHPYLVNFENEVNDTYPSHVQAGIGILESIKEDLESGHLTISPQSNNSIAKPVETIRNICDRFHLVVRQLRARHNDGETLDVQNEYDVQDLLHALLHLHFNDIRPEEWTPSYAGMSSRMDFLLKKEQTVIEVKMTRKGLNAKELGNQLIEDIARYQSHPECKTLICFVYDPEGRIANPRGIENDLNRAKQDLLVEVLIRP